MNEIAQFSRIKAYDLSGTFYFESLIEAGKKEHMMSSRETEKVYDECMEFLAYKIQRYTSKDSDSIRVERARSILQSCLYTAGLYLKTLQPDAAICAIKQEGIRKIYNAGRRKLDTKVKMARHLHRAVLEGMIKTNNLTYNETIIGGIKGFFKLYDANYAAHEIFITADYPLSNPPEDLAGIEFIIAYLKSVLLENEFCKHFTPASIHDALRAHHPDYEELVINIFDLILASALGSVLADVSPVGLLLPVSEVIRLQSSWLLKTKHEIQCMVWGAGVGMMQRFAIYEENQRRYIEKSLLQVGERIFLAVRTLTLDKVFACSG